MTSAIKYVAGMVRELREMSGGSQDELAAAIGTTGNTISRWETGIYKPSIEDLEKLARAWRVSMHVFLPADDDGRKPTAAMESLLVVARQLAPADLEEVCLYARYRRDKGSGVRQ